MAAKAVSPSFSSHQLVGSFQIATRLKIRSQLTSGALFRYRAQGLMIVVLYTSYTPENELKKLEGTSLANFIQFPLQSTTICVRFRNNPWISRFFEFQILFLQPLALKCCCFFCQETSRPGQRSRKYIMTLPENYYTYQIQLCSETRFNHPHNNKTIIYLKSLWICFFQNQLRADRSSFHTANMEPCCEPLKWTQPLQLPRAGSGEDFLWSRPGSFQDRERLERGDQ